MAVINSKNINNDDVTEVTDFIGINKRFKGLDSSLLGKGNQTDIDSLTASMADIVQNANGRGINVLHPPSPLVPAKGDNVTDDYSTISSIISYAQTNGYGTVFFPYTPNGYLLSSTLTIDISKIKIVGDGVKLNFTNSTIAIKFISPSTNVFSNTIRPISCFEIIGVGKAVTTSIGIQFADITGNYAPLIDVHNCFIHEFYMGTTWSNNTWLTTFTKCGFEHNFYDVYFPSGLTNSGENLVFDGCDFFNGDNGVYNAGCQMRFTNCSFDYLTSRYIQCISGGVVYLDNPHIEGNADNDYWLYTSGANSTIFVKGGTIAIAGAKSNYNIGQGNNTDGGIHLSNVFMIIIGSGSYTKQSLITGWGTCKNLLPYVVGVANRQGIDNLNYLAQGGFEAGNYNEWTSDGTVVPTIDATTAHSGTQSMKFASTSTKYVSVYHDVPCNPGDKPKSSFYMKINFNGSVDTFYMIAQYFDALGNALAPSTYTLSISAGSIPTALNGVNPTSGWALYSANPTTPAPAGATKCRFKLRQCNPTTTSDGLAVGWIDDIILTVD